MKSILAFVIVGLVVLSGHSKKEEVSGKVTIDYNVGINYVTHLYTLANIGFADEEYCNKYSHTVPLEDIKILQKYQEYLRFENGKSGLLTSNFFFIPAYANLKNKSDLTEPLEGGKLVCGLRKIKVWSSFSKLADSKGGALDALRRGRKALP